MALTKVILLSVLLSVVFPQTVTNFGFGGSLNPTIFTNNTTEVKVETDPGIDYILSKQSSTQKRPRP
jgi:hypothetical protein